MQLPTNTGVFVSSPALLEWALHMPAALDEAIQQMRHQLNRLARAKVEAIVKRDGNSLNAYWIHSLQSTQPPTIPVICCSLCCEVVPDGARTFHTRDALHCVCTYSADTRLCGSCLDKIRFQTTVGHPRCPYCTTECHARPRTLASLNCSDRGLRLS